MSHFLTPQPKSHLLGQCVKMITKAKAVNGRVMAEIYREEFDAEKGNAEISGRVVIKATVLPEKLADKVRDLVRRERAKEDAKNAEQRGERMSDFDLIKQLQTRAEEYARKLYPHAQLDEGRNVLEIEKGTHVILEGLYRGFVEIDGVRKSPLEVIAMALRCEHLDSVDWAEGYLAGQFDEPPEDVTATVPESVRFEPEPPAHVNGSTVPPKVTEIGPLPLPTPKALATRHDSRNPDTHQLLPQSPNAETSILCIMFMRPTETFRVLMEKGISGRHFHNPANRLIYETTMQLWGDQQLPEDGNDSTVVIEYLMTTKRITAAGGPANISEISTYNQGAVSNLLYYVEQVQETYGLREFIQRATHLVARCYEEQDNAAGVLADAEAQIIELTTPRKYHRLPLPIDMSTVLGANLPALPPELVEGLLHQGSKLVLGGTSKGRKTWALLDLAISVATGADFWGKKTKQGRVCYINFEIQAAFFAKRVDDICRAKGVQLAPGMLEGWTLRGHGEGIENLVEELMGYLRRGEYVLIIFDPIYKALGERDENKAGDIASLMNALEKIAVQTTAGIAFGAHYSKGNQASKDSIDRIGGSGVYARDPDAIIAMTAHEQDECFVVEPTLRNFAPMEPFVVKWEWPIFMVQEEMDAKALKQPQGAGGKFRKEWELKDLLDGLSVIEPEHPSKVQKRLAEDEGLGRATFYRLLREGKDKKLIIHKERGILRAPQSALRK